MSFLQKIDTLQNLHNSIRPEPTFPNYLGHKKQNNLLNVLFKHHEHNYGPVTRYSNVSYGPINYSETYSELPYLENNISENNYLIDE